MESDMNTARRAVVTGVIVLLCATIAQAKPNFSGRWKMNASRSDFGPITTPSSLVQQVTHEDPALKVVTTQVGEMGEFTVDSSYTTDGKECVNKFRDIERRSTVNWDGDSLVIESKMDIGGNAVTIGEKWSLSDDGKTLTINRHLKGPEGETDLRTVLEKQ
jgi:hypothetical protein